MAASNLPGLIITYVTFRQGCAEQMPVDSETADVVVSNGVINLCIDEPGRVPLLN